METCYADHAVQRTVTILENVQVGRDTWRVRFACPEIARHITAGQFVMLRIANRDNPLLGRPLAVYNVIFDAKNQPWALDVVYLVVGKMTKPLAEMQIGTKLDVWGPLGNGFPMLPSEEVIIVAGGIGQTPFLLLGKDYLGHGLAQLRDPSEQQPFVTADRVTLLYGARNKEYLACVDDFEKAGITVKVSTDDGSAGYHGLVTGLLKQELARPIVGKRTIFSCGPERMMEAVSEVALHNNVPCYVSLETPMACGIGICFSCVTKVKQDDGSWDYRRTCVEGPVFEAAKIEW